MEAAAERSARAAFALAGQVCISVQRVLVHESVDGRVHRARRVTVARSLVVGDQLIPSDRRRPDDRRAERPRGRRPGSRRRVAAGAHVVCGRRAAAAGSSTPTVLTDVPDEARIWRDEAFAPVMSRAAVSTTLDEAIARSTTRAYGLQAGIYTDRLEDALRAAHEIRVRRRHGQRRTHVPGRSHALRGGEGERPGAGGPAITRWRR